MARNTPTTKANLMQTIILIASLALNGLFFGVIAYLVLTENKRRERRELTRRIRETRTPTGAIIAAWLKAAERR